MQQLSEAHCHLIMQIQRTSMVEPKLCYSSNLKSQKSISGIKINLTVQKIFFPFHKPEQVAEDTEVEINDQFKTSQGHNGQNHKTARYK